MTCQQLSEFIGDYLAGELPRGESERFEHHLSICSTCRRYLDSYRKTVGVAVATKLDAPPAPIPEELVRAILASKSPPQR